ncbi:motile sperm domain-containing protein 1-like [Clavelina lepadiformis]|uniref:MSP domain-containing protein n=1 Tax=Clavelina lepadiformis TaxID=159417 RepID=A0ABP0G1Q9_CLALP
MSKPKRFSSSTEASSAGSRHATSLIENKKLPIFVSPDKLLFYSDDGESHKRVLTVYNPYDFPVSFKVLSTAPDCYIVSETRGRIKQHCCIDIVIRRSNFDSPTVGISNKFRVEIYQIDQSPSLLQASSNLLGVKEIEAILLSQSNQSRSDSISKSTISESVNSQSVVHQKTEIVGGLSSQLLLVSVAVICILPLIAHTVGEENTKSIIPTYFSVTAYQKMLACYILGLVTSAIFYKI